MRLEVATLLECLHGLCLGAQPGNCSVLAPVVLPLLGIAIRLLDVFQSAAEIIEVVLKAFVASADSLLLYVGDVSGEIELMCVNVTVLSLSGDLVEVLPCQFRIDKNVCKMQHGWVRPQHLLILF